MNNYRIIHTVALIALLVVASMSIAASRRPFAGRSVLEVIPTVIFAVIIWCWLIARIWKRPRQWGLGVGILLLVMVLFQTYLWRLSIVHPRPEIRAHSQSPISFVLYEVPLFVAAVLCILLRFRAPVGSAETQVS